MLVESSPEGRHGRSADFGFEEGRGLALVEVVNNGVWHLNLSPLPNSTLQPPPPHPNNDLCGRMTRFWLPQSRGRRRGRSETHRPLSHGPGASRPHHYHLISYNITPSVLISKTASTRVMERGRGGDIL